MKVVCQYAIIRFMPFVETGEFANVGIALQCPAAKYFGFRMLKRYGRVTRFFDGLEARIYTQAKRTFEEELRTYRSMLRAGPLSGRRHLPDIDLARVAFQELIRPREVMIRFSEPRALMTDAPDTALAELYNFYVERNFVSKEYKDQLLEKSVRRILSSHHLLNAYTDHRVGSEDFYVRFPFVHLEDERAAKAIKPLYLAHDEPNKILAHGGPWVDRMRRLRRRGLMPQEVMFAVDAPGQRQERRMDAFREICEDLEEVGVHVARVSERDQILEFARLDAAA